MDSFVGFKWEVEAAVIMSCHFDCEKVVLSLGAFYVNLASP